RGACAVRATGCPWHAREEPGRLPALRNEATDVVEEGRSHRCPGRREQRHEITLLATEQFVHRDTQRLAADVVQRDVDRGLSCRQDPAALEILAAVQALPDRAT